MFQDPKNSLEDDDKTVTLSGRDLRAATRLLNLILRTDDDRGEELTRLSLVDVTPDRSVLIERARQALVNRARRAQFFNRAMFGEAAWDMLLALYVTEQSGPTHTITGLIALSGVPSTTALRWLDFLENKEGLVERRPNPVDKRIFLIHLTDKARADLDAYFSGTIATAV